jgi:hypothetical protein
VYILTLLTFCLISICYGAFTSVDLQSTPLYTGDITSNFSTKYSCGQLCPYFTTLSLLPSTTAVDYEQIDFTFVVSNEKLPGSSSDNWVVEKYTLTPDGNTVTLPTYPQGTILTIFGVIKFKQIPENLNILSQQTQVRFRSTLDSTIGTDLSISTSFTLNLLLPNMPGVTNPPTPDPDTYSIAFPHKKKTTTTSSTSEEYSFSFTFLQYQWAYLDTIDLILQGSYSWNYNVTAAGVGLENCLVNGLEVKLKQLGGDKQAIRLTLPADISESLIASTPVTIICGYQDVTQFGVSIVRDISYDSVLLKNSATVQQFITVIPRFITPDYWTVPALSYTIPLDQGDYQLIPYNKGYTSSILPVNTYIDQAKSALFATFAIEFENMSQLSQSFDIGIELIGLRFDSISLVNPHLFLLIESDYKYDTFQQNSSTKPSTISHLLPIDIKTFKTPMLTISKGWNTIYNQSAAPNYYSAGKLPKRYVNIVIPFGPIAIEYLPVNLLLKIQPTAKTGSMITSSAQFTQSQTSPVPSSTTIVETSPLTTLQSTPIIDSSRKLSVSLPDNPSTTINISLLPYTIGTIRTGIYSFQLDPDYNSSAAFPTRTVSNYPSIKQRLFFNAPESPTVCEVRYYRCVYAGKGRSCNWGLDSGFQAILVQATPQHVEVNVVNLSPNPPTSGRQIFCNGVKLVSSNTIYSMDHSGYVFNNDSQNNIISDSSYSGIVYIGSSLFTKSKIKPSIIEHRGYVGAQLTAYREVYNGSDPISTVALIMICLIPVWVCILTVIILLVVLCGKDLFCCDSYCCDDCCDDCCDCDCDYCCDDCCDDCCGY